MEKSANEMTSHWTRCCVGSIQLPTSQVIFLTNIYIGEISGSRRRVWRWLSSGMLRRVVWQKFTNVSEVLAASIIRAMCDDWGSKHIWNVSKHIPDYMAQQLRRQPSLCLSIVFILLYKLISVDYRWKKYSVLRRISMWAAAVELNLCCFPGSWRRSTRAIFRVSKQTCSETHQSTPCCISGAQEVPMVTTRLSSVGTRHSMQVAVRQKVTNRGVAKVSRAG
jgi:hypothetical protein